MEPLEEIVWNLSRKPYRISLGNIMEAFQLIFGNLYRIFVQTIYKKYRNHFKELNGTILFNFMKRLNSFYETFYVTIL